jgi:hypothetical protein
MPSKTKENVLRLFLILIISKRYPPDYESINKHFAYIKKLFLLMKPNPKKSSQKSQ